MDIGTIAAGITEELTALGTEFGPIVLSIFGIAVGLWALKLGYGFLTSMVQARRARNS